MGVGAVVDYLFSNPALLGLMLLACALAGAISPRILIVGVSVFLGALLFSVGIVALFGFWRAGILPPLLAGTLGGLFVGWRLARRFRWFWVSPPKRRAYHSLLGAFFVLASIAALFSSQIGDYRLMRRLIAAEQSERLAILKQGDIPAMDDVPFFLDRFHADERSALFRAMLSGSEGWRRGLRARSSDLIHWAVDAGDRPLVAAALIWLKGDRDRFNSDRDPSIFWLAEQNWSQDEVRLLIESGLDVAQADKNGVVFAKELIMRNDRIDDLFWVLMESIPNLLETVADRSGRTYLELLAYRDRAVILTRLRKSGVDLAIRDRSGRTLLHHLAMGSVGAASIPLLVQAGIDVDAQDFYGVAALHIASFRHQELAGRLLSLSCPIDAQNGQGETALYLALRLDRNPPSFNLPDTQEWLRNGRAGTEIAQALLDFGADPRLADRWGNDALHYAMMNIRGDRLALNAIEILLEQGANPFLQSDKGLTPRSLLTPYLRDSSDYQGPDDEIAKAAAMLKKAEDDRIAQSAAKRP